LLAESIRIARRLGNPHRVAQGLEGVAVYAVSLGQTLAVWRFANAAAAIRQTIGAPLGPTEAGLLRDRLRPAGPPRPVDDGRAWSLERACSQALELLSAHRATAGLGRLTARESEVAALVARGLSNREIAEALTIAERTATSHVEHVLDKLGFHSRTQIATWVTEQGRGTPF
jgi:DNA-binding CsgD family transcriptional regulator